MKVLLLDFNLVLASGLTEIKSSSGLNCTVKESFKSIFIQLLRFKVNSAHKGLDIIVIA